MEDGHLVAAVNELLSRKYTKDLAGSWKCYCDKSCDRIEYTDELISTCAVFNLQSQYFVSLISIDCVFFSEGHTLCNSLLKASIRFLMASKKETVEGELIVDMLRQHRQLHPSCAPGLVSKFKELVLSKHQELDHMNLFDYVLNHLELDLCKSRTTVLNSRALRKKKKCDYTYDGDDKPKKQICKSFEDESCVDMNPKYKFCLLEFVNETLKHDFYSKYASSCDQKGNCLRDTLLGCLFLDFVGSTELNVNRVMRILEIYRYCDEDQRRVMNDLIEMVADMCLFLDSGKLTIENNILNSQYYPVSQTFCQYFCQIVFKRNSINDSVPIIRNLRPVWLRLNAAHYLLRQNWKNKIPKGLQCILLFMDSAARKVDVLKTLNDGTQSSYNNVITETQDELVSACRSDDVATLRKLSKTDIDFHVTDQSCCTILHLVAKYGSLECAKFLLKAIETNGPEDEYEITDQSYNVIFKKKLTPEVSLLLLHLYRSFYDTYHLDELLELYEQCKLNGVTDSRLDNQDYEFFAQLIVTYIELKKVISKITRIKDCPSHVAVFQYV